MSDCQSLEVSLAQVYYPLPFSQPGKLILITNDHAKSTFHLALFLDQFLSGSKLFFDQACNASLMCDVQFKLLQQARMILPPGQTEIIN